MGGFIGLRGFIGLIGLIGFIGIFRVFLGFRVCGFRMVQRFRVLGFGCKTRFGDRPRGIYTREERAAVFLPEKFAMLLLWVPDCNDTATPWILKDVGLMIKAPSPKPPNLKPW